MFKNYIYWTLANPKCLPWTKHACAWTRTQWCI